MTEAQARARLERMLAVSDLPALTSAEVDDLMRLARRSDRYATWADAYTAWKAALAVAVGDLVVPSTRNGHYYRVTVSDGTAGAVEPTWPTTSGATVASDGVTYAEAGSAPWIGTWDLNATAAEGWRWKAAKVAASFSFAVDGDSYQESQTHAMCLQMADRYQRKVQGTLTSGEPLDTEYVVANRAEV